MNHIPDFQTLMRPLLELHADGLEHLNRDLVESLGTQFNLTDLERRAMLPSGRAKLFDNRVGWAKNYLVKAGLISAPRRAISIITPSGTQLLASHAGPINVALLNTLTHTKPKQAAAQTTKQTSNTDVTQDTVNPIEAAELAHQRIRQEIEQDLLEKIANNTPDFLERLVVDLIVKMGYGGSIKDAGEAIGRSGDEGIDGIIKEDPLGLDTIYLQAKRYEGTIGRPEIQKFAGALQGQRAKKGIFITTSSYTKEARDYVSKIDSKIILIDGPTLAQLMYDHDVGVQLQTIYSVKRVDADYFDEA
jgi:restriction system protein